MGQPKALLPVPAISSPSPRPLLIHIASRLQSITPVQTLVVANREVTRGLRTWLADEEHEAAVPLTLLADCDPPAGPLGGLATGLARCTGWAALVACDMPLVNPDIFRRLQEIAAQEEVDAVVPDAVVPDAVVPDAVVPDAVVPIVDERMQPLHALYHRRCLSAIEAKLSLGERRMDAFFADVRVRYVDESALRPIEPTLHSFMNVNTPQAWQHALDLLAERTGGEPS